MEQRIPADHPRRTRRRDYTATVPRAVVPSYLGHAIMENRNGKESTWALAPAGFVSPVKAFLVL
jgi:hypothetical protein